MSDEQEMHELVPFLVIHADRYRELYQLDGLHPTHYDLMAKYGCKMTHFKRATNAPDSASPQPSERSGDTTNGESW